MTQNTRPAVRRTFLNAALTLLLLSGAASAATPAINSSPYLGANITRTYSIEDLMTRPGLLKIGKGDMVILDFPANVAAIMTGQIPMMDIPAPTDNIAVITGKVSSGSAQLMVQLDNGKYATFQIEFTAGGNGMKRIKVTDIPATDYAQPLPATAPTSTTFPAMPVSAAQAQAKPAQTEQGAALPITGPVQATPTRPQPAWLRLESSVRDNGSLTITVSNSGVRPITLNTRNLYITDQDRSMPVTYDQDVTVNAGAQQTFIVPLPEQASVSSNLRVTWTALDAGANTEYLLSNR